MKSFFLKKVSLLLLLPIIASTQALPQSAANKPQGSPVPSSMTLEQSVEWLRKNLAAMGKQRLVMKSHNFACDITFTSVALERSSLTLGYLEDCKAAGESWTQKFIDTIPLADIASEKFSVVELEVDQPAGSDKACNLHIVMVEGKKMQVHRTRTQKGKSETKDFAHNEREIYFSSKEKAYQTIEVLRRMIDLVATKQTKNE